MDKNSKIFIAGHTGMVGSNLLDKLKQLGYRNIIYTSHKKLDLLDTKQVATFFSQNNIEYCFLCAARVGGIKDSVNHQADFIYENTIIQTNVIKNCHDFGIKKLLFLASSCCYPRDIALPIAEQALMSHYPEQTNVGYSIAKINGIIMCQMFKEQYHDNFISVMPCNLYGKNDRYDLTNGHVFPTLIMKIHNAKIHNLSHIELWGTGQPKREFLFAEDLAEALVFLMRNYDDTEIVNVGYGQDISILDLAKLMCEVIGYRGEIKFNTTEVEGVPRKVLDISKITKLGWKPKTPLRIGIKKAYNLYLQRIQNA